MCANCKLVYNHNPKTAILLHISYAMLTAFRETFSFAQISTSNLNPTEMFYNFNEVMPTDWFALVLLPTATLSWLCSL